MSDEKNNLTIGKKLHDARVAKGYTLDDLQKNTKIQKRYLIAIEDDDFDALPGEFYVRAFVKQYADAVGLNGSELLNENKKSLPDTQNPEYVDRVNDDNPETRTAQRKEDERHEKFRRYIPIAGVSLVVLIILVAIWVAAAKTTHNTAKTAIETSKVSVSSNKANSSSAPAKKVSAPVSNISFTKLSQSGNDITYRVKNAPKSLNIKVSVKRSAAGTAWTSVSADGSSLWQASLSSGKSKTVKIPAGASSISINLGNAIDSTVTLNGKKVNLGLTSNTASAQGTTTGSNQVRVITLELKSGAVKSATTTSSNGTSTGTGTTSTNNAGYTTSSTNSTSATTRTTTNGSSY